ncbi:hypothetical protein G7B40_041120 [Aetokthonos hydrillicola Thurmond2011]|jgi:hypothetical protein|uniref:Uncharacterized protein n=1 Tax=Aetokthonos hydrillicola Thurmond2011 TaxID=2712845 RepID=A0AAP5MEF7_9CYAN|nr:hypothetical protein [Aetokthonos hydrillicola]MBO3463408.1 hypothetical protein [Aetokthonos hydrillicola CCALA 1050]MBW4590867.1 hypothetical protein [Aetokthonos hydrillicola CCALA 1050]MDR9900889.1 hypothetical protein [Aetokthonos hydrillicola Thurmond2011]
MKRVVIRTRTEEKSDGEIATFTERIEESSNSGLLEAWGFLALIMSTILLTLATYRVVSSINQPQDNNYGFQTGQTK